MIREHKDKLPKVIGEKSKEYLRFFRHKLWLWVRRRESNCMPYRRSKKWEKNLVYHTSTCVPTMMDVNLQRILCEESLKAHDDDHCKG